MSSRAARKILKLREAKLQRESIDNGNDSNESDSNSDTNDRPALAKPGNTFAMLMAQNEDEDDDENSNNENNKVAVAPRMTASKKKNKKKNKKKVLVQEGNDASETENTTVTRKPIKHTGKNTIEDNGLDEIDRAIKEVNDKLGIQESALASAIPGGSGSSASQTLTAKKKKDLLGIDLKLLDADAEMRRMFGSKIVADEIKNKKYKRGRVATGINNMTGERTYLVTPRDGWPRLQTKIGISMNMLQSPSKPGEEAAPGYFEFTYSSTYNEIQIMFLQCVNTHDPGTISNLLRAYPFHIDALLQSSEVAKHNGDINTAAEYIERALYIFERSFHPLFNLATANAVLPYSYPENRAFFLALSRHISFIARKGCWRTCLELTKLMFSCDPEDPLGALQMMDWYADHEISTKLLTTAILQYPQIVPQLLSKLTLSVPNITNNPVFSSPDVLSTKSNDAIRVLITLYIERCHHLWKEPTAFAWFRATVSSVAEKYTLSDSLVQQYATKRKDLYPQGLPLNVSRHVYVSDFVAIVPFLPDDARKLSLNAFDPMPPPPDVEDEENGEEDDGNRSRGGGIVLSVGWIVDRLRNLMVRVGDVHNNDDEGDDDDERTDGED
ncbi:Transcription factor 25 [Physocladia obscura]|uniref:Transcription factor 25 n=1 Tax=Physocladia obscura TaxID=109957 RepID=A0AAD5SWH4_9FUNG|nr:Transcription factor 25 [Physocladia obscura]